MSARLEALFYPEGSETLGRRWLLAPLGLAEQAFRAGVALRTAAYARGWARPARVEGLRIVSVGNLTVGGAGKTPVVRALAERLVAFGESVAILSRGYGRLAPGELRVEGPRWPSADVAGDEPLMLARSLPGVRVWVGSDRIRLAHRARADGATVALLDDGFQTRRLARDVDLVVVDEAVGLGNGHLLPRGPLREPPEALRRASLLWVRVADRPAPVPWPAGVPRIRARHAARDLVGPTGEVTSAGALGGRRVLAFCGIARPAAFRRTVEGLGAEVVSLEAFADHHPYAAVDLQALKQAAAATGALLLTTEKDAARLPDGFPASVLRLGVTVLEGEELLRRELARPLPVGESERPLASDLSHLLESFAARKVVVLGDLVADHYIYGQTDRVSREAPVLVVRHESSEVTLGGAANAAANARTLGAEVVAVGVIGRDEIGAQLRTAFAQRDVQLAAVELPPLVTETKTRILAGGLNTSRQQMLRLDRGNPLPLPPVAVQALVVALERAVVGADAVLVSDYGGGVVGEATRAVLSRLRKQGTRVVVDSRYDLAALSGYSAAKPNEPELAALTGLPVDDDRGVEQAALAAQRRLDVDVLLVTRGRRGMALLQRGGKVELLAAHGNRAAVDVTGAGDTVMAAFTLALGAGATPRQAAELANVAGALVVLKPGTATLSVGELQAELGSG